MNALILIDIQRDFIPGGNLPVPAGHEVIPLINTLQHSFPLVIATQDWHPRTHQSFASHHPGKDSFEEIMLHGRMQTLWPDHCVQGSPGAQFHPDLEMHRVSAIFRKGMDSEVDSYSAFYDNSRQRSTGLAGYLRELDVDRLFLTGLAADVCVFFTALDACNEHFETFVIEDATRALRVSDFKKVETQIMAAGGRVITSDVLHRYL